MVSPTPGAPAQSGATQAHDEVAPLLARAAALETDAQVLQAELLYRRVLTRIPHHPLAALGVARLALQREDGAVAVAVLDQAHAAHPEVEDLLIQRAMARLMFGEVEEAIHLLRASLAQRPEQPTAWLLLGDLAADRAEPALALSARFEAVTRAMAAGHWRDPATTPPQLAQTIARAKSEVRAHRAALFYGSYADLRREFGDGPLQRMDHAVAGYLGEAEVAPASPRQQPSFFYFPGLPATAYHDPDWQPWAARLQRHWSAIRDEAMRVLNEDARLPDFVELPPGAAMSDYVAGSGPAPAWEAFFFYRHGQRYDANHLRCPATSAVLDTLDLCHLPHQAPEILFSVLRAGSDIKRHYGTTNVRLVMHLPLVVPAQCALHVVDHGEHAWQEGRLMLFDDTYLHEAWNRSDHDRVVLLLDCWHPHLTAIERRAVQRFIATATAFTRANRGP